MPYFKRQSALVALLAVLLYLIPNLVQDIHRVYGQHEFFVENGSQTGKQIHNHFEKCNICIFEFYVTDGIANPFIAQIQQTPSLLLIEKQDNQIQNSTFHYYNLRAPPQA
jgi:hypothetical protein